MNVLEALIFDYMVGAEVDEDVRVAMVKEQRSRAEDCYRSGGGLCRFRL
jgi:hypothetical protein